MLNTPKSFRTAKSIILLIILLSIQFAQAQQIENGCSEANFGVDADLYANSSAFGQNATNAPNTDDWFANPSIATGLGIGVINVSQATTLQQNLQAGQNLQVILGMSVPFNTVHQGVRFLDAIYGRDFFGGSQATDLTSFIQASKNGEDPAIWDTGPANVVPKNDLIDCYAHLRRDGTNGNDALWLFGGFSRISNRGDSYLDMELYAQDIFYDPSSGFTSAGPDEGHTSWKFDNAGNIIQAGDIVVTVHYSTNGAPELELRIWVARNDWQNTNAATFSFGNEFDGGSNASQFGYADILPPTNGIYACGLGNSSTSFAPPWGTLDPGGNYSLSYEENQFAEIGLNLNAFGIDPALNLHTDNGPCTIPFSSVIFKARASNSFTAQLKDFAGPYPFDVPVLIPSEIAGDTITCAQSIATLTPITLTADAVYMWSTSDGNIISPTDSLAIDVDAPGTYTLIATSAPGCLADTSSFYVPAIYNYPDANISADTIFDCGVIAELRATPDNHIYEWSGPLNFYATDQIINVSEEGLYIVNITDPASQCSTLDSIYLPGGPCVAIDPSLLPFDENMVVLIDDEIPTAGFPADVTLYCLDDISDLSLNGEIEWISDNCPENMPVPFFLDIAAGGDCVGSLTYNRLWYVRDFCGNLAFHTQVINLIDTLAPYFTTPLDVTIDCTNDINDLSNIGDVLDEGDDCDGTIGEATYQDSIVVGSSCTGNDVIYREWTLSDACGNEYSDFQIISFGDNTPPAFSTPNDITISCTEDPSDLTLTGIITDTTDNCGTPNLSVTFTDQILADTNCALNYSINRTWLVTDGCGNFTDGIQTIFVEDISAPLFDVPADLTVSCEIEDNDLLTLGIPTNISDNCQTNLGTPSYRDSIIGMGPCEETKTVLRIWELSDACGNTATETQLIEFEDISNPTFTVPQDVTIECDEDPNDLILTGDVFDEFDNCSAGTLDATYVDNITSGTPCNGSLLIDRTWTLVDDCGNTTQAVQQITMEDSTPPTFELNVGPPSISCDTTLPTPVVGVDIIISDACDTSLTIYYNETQTDIVCPNVYILRRVWTAEDNCGNIDSLVQEITVEDSGDPVILVFPPDITVSCDSILPPSGAVVEDNCSSTVTVNVVESTIPGTCDFAYILVRTWSWEDDCGNTNETSQEITVIDESSPTFTPPADTILSCDANLADLNQTGTIDNEVDNCDPNTLNVDYRDSVITNFPCEGSMRVLRIWEVSDTCGNENSHIQVIDLFDSTPPVLVAPGDVTLSCDQDPTDLGLSGTIISATDNCDSNLGGATYQDSIVINQPCLGSSLIYRNWSLADACGNSTTVIQLITLSDTLAPTFTPPADITLACDVNPNDLTFTGDVLDEFDNCQNIIGDATYVDSILIDQPCGGSTEIFRRWTLTDNCGNSVSEVQYIQLLDTIAPEMNLPDDITLDCEIDITDLSFTGQVSPMGTDCDPNAGAGTYRDSLLSTTGCASEQIFIRIWSLEDDCGNINMGNQLITLSDQVPPTFIVPEDLTLDCGTDPLDLNITGNPDSLSDNCSDVNLSINYQDSILNLNNCGGSYTLRRTWTAADDCGNHFSQNQFITFIDTIAPTFTAPIDLTITCTDDVSDLNLVGSVDTSSIVENCSAATVIIFYRDSISVGSGCSEDYDVIRTWIVRDDCGNTTENIQEIAIRDQTAPVFDAPADTTLDCGTDISVLGITGTITNFIDECSDGTMISIYSDSIVLGTDICVASEIIYRTWTLTDPCGNSDTRVQIITLVDVLPPVFFIPSDTMLHCSADYMDLTVTGISFGAMDICDDNLGEAGYRDSLVVSDTCALDQAIYRTWSLADICGNNTEYLQIIYLIDTVGPTFTVPADVTIDCTTDADDLLITGSPTDAFFNCQDQSSQVTYQDSQTVNPICSSNFIYRTWTLSNGCGQDTSQLQIIELIDTIAPFFTNFPTDITIGCTDTIPDFNIQYQDSCGFAVTLEIFQDTVPAGCLSQLLIQRNFVISDNCGNQDSTLQNIIVENCGSILELTTNDNISECPGETITLGVTESEQTAGVNFQWQFFNTPNWENIVGATDSIYEIQNLDNTHEGNYRCLAAGEIIDLDNDNCRIESPEITVEVFDPGPIEIVAHQVCAGDSIQINNQYYSTAGTFYDTLANSNNCDSIIQIDLAIIPLSESQIDYNICQGDSIQIDGAWIFNSTTIVDTIANNAGCDSLHITNIVVDIWTDAYETREACIGDSLFVGGDWQNQNGTYLDTLSSSNGCDTILHTELLFQTSVSENIDYALCDGDTLFLGTQIITTAGTWTETLTAAAGCDSIVTAEVFIIPSYFNNTDTTLCVGDSIIFQGNWFNSSGVYNDTLTTIMGCDSILQLTLNYAEVYDLRDTLTTCLGDSLQVAGIIFFNNATYVDSLISQAGCDSIITYQLNFNPLDTTELFREICVGEYYVFNTDSLNTSGTYTADFTNQYGCDSIVRLELEVLTVLNEMDSINLCVGDSITIFGQTIFTDGSYADTLVSQNGCDSIITLMIQFHPVDTTNLALQFCVGESYIFNNDTLTTNGDFSQLLNNQYGCDSLVLLNLEFIEAFNIADTIDLCEGDSVIIDGMTIDYAGTFPDSLRSQAGCDSIINYTVIVHPLDTTNLNQQICVGEHFVFNTDTLNTSGTYIANFTNQLGCDSLVQLELAVLDVLSEMELLDLCVGDSITIFGQTIFDNGTYADTLLSHSGCDSIITYMIEFHPVDTTNIAETRCLGESYIFNNDTLTMNGNYSQIFNNQYGCDSLVLLNLEFIDAFMTADTIDLCEGESVIINGSPVITAGSHSEIFVTQAGCDSIVDYTVIVHPLDTTNFNQQICSGDQYIFNNDTLSTTGTYSNVFTNQFGCDSLVNLELVIVEKIVEDITHFLCPDEPITINGIDYGIDTLLIIDDISQSGCDSTTNITIIVESEYLETINYQICLGDSLELFGNYYSQDTEIREESQSQHGCDSTIIHILEVIPVAELIVDDAFICLGDTVQLFAEGAQNVTWSPATGLSCADCINPFASPQQTTTYTVSTVSCQGQTVSQLVTVYVRELPTVEIIAEGELIQGDTLALTYEVSDTTLQISWYEAPNDLICQNNCPDSLIVVPTLSSTYIVEAVDTEGCKNQDEISVRVKSECVDAEFFFPNFITPNFDGKNDEFVVSYDAIKEMSLIRIYNRWGQLIFETTDIDNIHWDGTFRGKPVNAGVYVFYVEGFCLNNSPFVEKGNITVIR